MEISIPIEKIVDPTAADGMISLTKGGAPGQQCVGDGPVRHAVEASNAAFSMMDEMAELYAGGCGVFGSSVNLIFGGKDGLVEAKVIPVLSSSTSTQQREGVEVSSTPPEFFPDYASTGASKYYDANFYWVGGVRGGALKVSVQGKVNKSVAEATVRDDVILAEAAHRRGFAERAVRYCYPSFLRTIHRMEWIGGKVSWLLGLESSRFQYAVDEYNRQKAMKEHREAMAAKRKQEEYLAKGLEGMDDPSDDVADLPYAPPPTA